MYGRDKLAPVHARAHGYRPEQQEMENKANVLDSVMSKSAAAADNDDGEDTTKQEEKERVGQRAVSCHNFHPSDSDQDPESGAVHDGTDSSLALDQEHDE